MEPGATNGPDEIFKLLRERSLPGAMRGYDREATDQLLSKLEQRLEATLQQHGATLARLRDLERRLEEGQEREEAVTEALVLATKIRADSEREGKEIKERYAVEAQAITTDAQHRTEEILRQAETDAQGIIEDAQNKARLLDQRIRDGEELAQQVQTHLRSFLQSMLDEVEHRNQESASIVGDLLARAGWTSSVEHEVAIAPAQVAQDGQVPQETENTPGGFA